MVLNGFFGGEKPGFWGVAGGGGGCFWVTNVKTTIFVGCSTGLLHFYTSSFLLLFGREF